MRSLIFHAPTGEYETIEGEQFASARISKPSAGSKPSQLLLHLPEGGTPQRDVSDFRPLTLHGSNWSASTVDRVKKVTFGDHPIYAVHFADSGAWSFSKSLDGTNPLKIVIPGIGAVTHVDDVPYSSLPSLSRNPSNMLTAVTIKDKVYVYDGKSCLLLEDRSDFDEVYVNEAQKQDSFYVRRGPQWREVRWYYSFEDQGKCEQPVP